MMKEGLLIGSNYLQRVLVSLEHVAPHVEVHRHFKARLIT